MFGEDGGGSGIYWKMLTCPSWMQNLSADVDGSTDVWNGRMLSLIQRNGSRANGLKTCFITLGMWLLLYI